MAISDGLLTAMIIVGMISFILAGMGGMLYIALVVKINCDHQMQQEQEPRRQQRLSTTDGESGD
jgi:hypothetical protein